MAEDEDWLARQAAMAQSPFQTFQRPDAPFGPPNPGPDTVYTTQDINRIQAHQGRSNPLKAAFGWLKGLLPHGEEKANRQSAPEAIGSLDLGSMEGMRQQLREDPAAFRAKMGGGSADPKAVGFGERLTDLPARALNLAAGVPEALLHSGEHYAGWREGTSGERAPGGTHFDPLAVAVPPQAMAAFVPGLRGTIARGEANPISTYDKVRAKLDEVPLANWSRSNGVAGEWSKLPLPGAPVESAIWPGADFLPDKGPARFDQQNPFSPAAGKMRQLLKSTFDQEVWPKAPEFVDSTPVGPTGNMRELPDKPGNNRNIGVVNLKAESGERLAPFAKRTEPLPLTQGVADWLREAGKEPSLRLARGKNETDYVSLPHGPADRERVLPRTKVRVADDGHAGWPEAGLIDTAGAKPGRSDPDILSRLNAAGESFSKPDNLIDALKWATSSAPGGGNWLVAPGKEPRWARYPREEQPAAPSFRDSSEPTQGPLQPSPLAQSGGELWAKGDPLHTALVAARNDPARKAAIEATLAATKGVSPAGIANVMESQHGIPKTGERWWESKDWGISGRPMKRYFGEGFHGPMDKSIADRMATVMDMMKRTLPSRAGTAWKNPWTPDDITKTKQIIGEHETTSPSKVWAAFKEKHPERAAELGKAKVDERALRRMMIDNSNTLGLDMTKRLGVGESRPWAAQSQGARYKDPAFAQKFWETWDKHNGRQQSVADELGMPMTTVNRYQHVVERPAGMPPPPVRDIKAERQERWKDIRNSDPSAMQAARLAQETAREGFGPTGKKLGSVAKAQREERSQAKRNGPELEWREGKPFWDETGRAEATARDEESVRRLFGNAKKPPGDDTVFSKYDERQLVPATPGDAYQGDKLKPFLRKRAGYSVLNGKRMDQLKEAYDKGASEQDLRGIAHGPFDEKSVGAHPDYPGSDRIDFRGKREGSIPPHGWQNLMYWLRTGRMFKPDGTLPFEGPGSIADWPETSVGGPKKKGDY